MKTVFTSLILFTIVSLHTVAQDTSKWGLPEGAKARLGKGYISELMYSPDGTRLAVGCSSGVWLYDSTTGRPIALMRDGNTFNARSVAYSPDGGMLAFAAEGIIGVWDAVTGELRNILRAKYGSAWHAAFSSDGRTIATSDEDVVRVWDTETGELRHTLQRGHEEGFGNVWCLAFSPDGRTLASGHISLGVGHSARNGIIRLWDAATGELQNTFSEGVRRPLRLAFSPDGRTLAVGHLAWAFGAGAWGWVTLRNAATGELKHELQGHAGGVYNLAYSADGRTLASGSDIDEWGPQQGHHGTYLGRSDGGAPTLAGNLCVGSEQPCTQP